MMLSNLVLGTVAALAVSSGVLAGPIRKTTVKSSAKCTAVSIGYSEIQNENARAEAAADAAAYLCSDGKGKATAHSIAQATAEAFAKAVAAASVHCEASGNTSVYAKASSKAKAEGKVWLDAYASAIASADVCGECEAFTSFEAHIKEEVFLSAIAEANAEFQGYTSSDGARELVAHVHDAQEVIHKAVATAYAEALAQAKKKDLAECDTKIKIEGSTPNGKFECEAASVSLSKIKQIDAIAEASADAAAYSCGDGFSHAEAKVVAKAVARATATAVSYVAADCYVKGKGYACGFSSADAEAVARATAKAFAEGWAGAINCEGCAVEVDATAEAMGTILVKAVSDAYVDLCIGTDGGGAFIELEALSVAIADASLEAVASVIVEAVATNEYCFADVEVDAKVCSCADAFKICKKRNDDHVSPCCEDGYVCRKWWRGQGRCMPGKRVPRSRTYKPTC